MCPAHAQRFSLTPLSCHLSHTPPQALVRHRSIQLVPLHFLYPPPPRAIIHIQHCRLCPDWHLPDGSINTAWHPQLLFALTSAAAFCLFPVLYITGFSTFAQAVLFDASDCADVV